MHRPAKPHTSLHRAAAFSPYTVSLLWSVFATFCTACGPSLPARYVIEQDVAAYRYRRYQQLLDVELQVEGNPAISHAATYVRSGETVQMVPVVLTAYESANGLAEDLRQRLRGIEGYTLGAANVSGSDVWHFRGEDGDAWWLWVSGPYFIKLGAAEGESEPPEALAEAYLKLYPSAVAHHGKVAAPRVESAP